MNFLSVDYGITKNTQSLSVVLEDSIMQKGKPCTAGSNMLSNFSSPFDATVVTKLKDAKVQILGKTVMNEFGVAQMDSEKEPLAGAVSAVASDYCDAALCNDYFGTVKRQAACNGLYYIQPTYGTVSRFGLIAAAASMDQIGIVCKTLKTGFEILSIIAGHDEKDGAMFPEKEYTYTPSEEAIVMGENIELPYFETYGQVHYILSCAELSNNINRFDGIKFGYRSPNFRTLNDLYLNSRTEGFDIDVKLAAIMGSMVLSKDQYLPYYDKAMRIRRLIQESLSFDSYNVLAMPAVSGEVLTQNAHMALPVLAGLPSLTMPYKEGVIQFIVKAKGENILYAAGEVANS